MRVLIVTPAPAGSRLGNRVSAVRWARLLRRQGHRVTLAPAYAGQRCDVLIALHALGSGASVRRYRRERPAAPLLLVLTGTDLYRDLPRRRTRARVLRALAWADRIVTLNLEAVHQVPRRFRAKLRCVLQAPELPPPRGGVANREGAFIVAMVGHLRREKDPLRAAYAVRSVPAASRLRVEQAGRALSPVWARRAGREMQRNSRYHWLEERSAAQVAALLAKASVLVHPSRMEGGAQAIGEALRAGLPVLASRVPGNVGLLGRAHPGLFPLGSTAALRKLLLRAEREPAFLARLKRAGQRGAARFTAEREALGWGAVLEDLAALHRVRK